MERDLQHTADVDGGGRRRQRVHPSTSEAQPPLLLAQARDDVRHPSRPLLARLGAIAAQRCPACLVGPVFQAPWRVLDKCPACGHYYASPAGAARVAMVGFCGVLTLVLAVAALAGMLHALHVLAPPRVGPEPAVLGALGVETLLVPWIYRHTRVLWEHLRLPTRG